MGAGQSGGVEIGGSSLGYQVLRVYPNSPGSRAGLKAYFDFIVAIANTRFNREDGSLREILKASVDQKLKMIVFNTRNKMAREVEIIPTTSWGGSGLLGVSIKHSSFDKADERVWHVVEVDPGSPASLAGFKAGEDYVIGSDSILQENDDLYNLIEAHEGKALKLFVYNVKTDNCREVICHPNSKWGGRGYLGCEFGHGLLHRIPYTDNQVAGGDSRPLVSSSPSFAQTQHQTNGAAPPRSQPPMQSQQQPPKSFAQIPAQPGHQLFQKALFDQSPIRPPQQQQPYQPVNEPPVLPQPPPAPKTFAQLASAQFQTQQSPVPSPPPPAQQPQQPPAMSQSKAPNTPEANHYQVSPQQSYYMQSQFCPDPILGQGYSIPQQTMPGYLPQPSTQNQDSMQVPNFSEQSAPPPLPPPQFSSGLANQPQSYLTSQNLIDQTQQSAQGQQYHGFQQ